MTTVGIVSVAVIGYALIAALAYGLCLGRGIGCDCEEMSSDYPTLCPPKDRPAGKHWGDPGVKALHHGRCDSRGNASTWAAFWPLTGSVYAIYTFVLVPWWTRVLVPVAEWSEKVFAPKDEAP